MAGIASVNAGGNSFFICGFVTQCIMIVETSNLVAQLKTKHCLKYLTFSLNCPPKIGCLVHTTMTALYQKALSVYKYNLLNFSKHITTSGEESMKLSNKCS